MIRLWFTGDELPGAKNFSNDEEIGGELVTHLLRQAGRVASVGAAVAAAAAISTAALGATDEVVPQPPPLDEEPPSLVWTPQRIVPFAPHADPDELPQLRFDEEHAATPWAVVPRIPVFLEPHEEDALPQLGYDDDPNIPIVVVRPLGLPSPVIEPDELLQLRIDEDHPAPLAWTPQPTVTPVPWVEPDELPQIWIDESDAGPLVVVPRAASWLPTIDEEWVPEAVVTIVDEDTPPPLVSTPRAVSTLAPWEADERVPAVHFDEEATGALATADRPVRLPNPWWGDQDEVARLGLDEEHSAVPLAAVPRVPVFLAPNDDDALPPRLEDESQTPVVVVRPLGASHVAIEPDELPQLRVEDDHPIPRVVVRELGRSLPSIDGDELLQIRIEDESHSPVLVVRQLGAQLPVVEPDQVPQLRLQEAEAGPLVVVPRVVASIPSIDEEWVPQPVVAIIDEVTPPPLVSVPRIVSKLTPWEGDDRVTFVAPKDEDAAPPTPVLLRAVQLPDSAHHQDEIARIGVEDDAVPVWRAVLRTPSVFVGTGDDERAPVLDEGAGAPTVVAVSRRQPAALTVLDEDWVPTALEEDAEPVLVVVRQTPHRGTYWAVDEEAADLRSFGLEDDVWVDQFVHAVPRQLAAGQPLGDQANSDRFRRLRIPSQIIVGIGRDADTIGASRGTLIIGAPRDTEM